MMFYELILLRESLIVFTGFLLLSPGDARRGPGHAPLVALHGCGLWEWRSP